MTMLADPFVKPVTPPATTPDATFIAYQERYECPYCEGCVPLDAVKRHEPDPHEIRQNLRRISIYCHACRKGFQATFRFSGGLLQPASGISVIVDQDEIRQLREGLERSQGTRQIRRPEPSKAAVRAEPSAGELEIIALDQAIAAKEAELAAVRDRQRNAVRRLVSARRIAPAAVDLDAQRMDTDCDTAAAKAEPVAESARTLDTSTSQILSTQHSVLSTQHSRDRWPPDDFVDNDPDGQS